MAEERDRNDFIRKRDGIASQGELKSARLDEKSLDDDPAGGHPTTSEPNLAERQ